MRRSRTLHLIVLVTFLAATTGCTKTRTVEVSTDPTATSTSFSEGERLEISGYRLVGEDSRAWKGEVSFVPPDSLRFEPASGPQPKPATFGGSSAPHRTGSFTVHGSAIRSIDVVETDYTSSLLLGLTLAAAAVLVVGFFAILLDGPEIAP